MQFISALLIVLCGLGSADCLDCQPGWNQFQNKCYWFSHTARPWGEAEIVYDVTDLLDAQFRETEEWINLFHNWPLHDDSSFYWIGISDLIEEDRWIYSSNMQTITTNYFSPGEPNQHTDANCVALWDRYHGKWADESCGHVYRFICETDVAEGDIVG